MSRLMEAYDPAGTTLAGGIGPVRGYDLGDGSYALVVISGAANQDSIAPATSSTQLLAPNPSRIGATVVNSDTAKNLYLGYNGATAVVGTNTLKPGQSVRVPANVVAGQLNGIWDSGATGNAAITEVTI